jgi:hypothetical protein
MKLPKLTMKQKVLFGRIRAVTWLIIGGLSFLLGWESSVILVWIASFYANAESGFATGEAADDSLVMKELKAHREMLEKIIEQQNDKTAGTRNE